MAMVPITMEKVVQMVVRGGHCGKKPVYLDIEQVNDDGVDRCFFRLSMKDRELSRALGRSLKNSTAIEILKQYRDEAVDEVFKTFLANEDPMADAEAVLLDRQKLMARCAVPDVVEIHLPAFQLEGGGQVRSQSMLIMSATRKTMSPCIEATEANFAWLAQACQHDWTQQLRKIKEELPQGTKRNRTMLEVEDLPKLPEPLKYDLSSQGKICIHFYQKVGSAWRKHAKSIGEEVYSGLETQEERDNMVLSLAKIMQNQYQKLQKDPED